MIRDATTDDLAGTPVIKSRCGWRPVEVSGRGSAKTIKCAAFNGALGGAPAADKCFLSPLRSDEMSLVASELS